MKAVKRATCKCGYNTSTSAKKPTCPKCRVPLTLSTQWYAMGQHLGKKLFEPCGPKKADAEDFIAATRLAKRAGTVLPGQEKDITWEEAKANCLKWWADAVTRKEIRQSTADYHADLLPVVSPYFENKTLLTITKEDIRDYQSARIRKGISAATVNHGLRVIKRMYNMHVDHTSAEESPRLCAKAADIGRVPLLPRDSKRVRFLTGEEITLLLENAASPDIKLAALISLNTGLRKGNVFPLTWAEVKLSDKVITYTGDMMKSTREHTVDIPAHLIAILKAWKLSNGFGPQLFSKSKSVLRLEWEKTIAACGFKGDVTFHTLRHTFASQWIMNGGDLPTLSKVMDHSSIQITMDTYSHLSRDHKKKATDQFAEAFMAKFG